MKNPGILASRARLSLLILAGGVSLCAVPACSKETAPAAAAEIVEEHFTDPIAVVNGLAIYESTYEQILVSMRDKIPENHPNGVEKYLAAKYDALEKAIDEELLFQEAVRRGHALPEDRVMKIFEEQARRAGGEEPYLQGALLHHLSKSEILQNIRKTAAIKKLVEEEIEKGLRASESEIRAFYDARPDLYTPDPWVSLGQIFVSAPIEEPAETRSRALSRISAALGELHGGRSFESVAREYSEDQAAESGGRLGLFKKGNLIPEVDKVAFSLQENTVSGIIESDMGYHIIRIYERKGGQLEPYDKVKDRVRDDLIKKMRADKLNALVASLRESAEIERLLT